MLECHDLDGEWLAVVRGGYRSKRYRAKGATRHEAVRKMRDFLQDKHPEVYEANMDALETFSHPIDPPETAMEFMKKLRERNREEEYVDLCSITEEISGSVAAGDLSKLAQLHEKQAKAIAKLKAEDFALKKTNEILSEDGSIEDLVRALLDHLQSYDSSPTSVDQIYLEEIGHLYSDIEEYLPPEPKHPVVR
jgi:hypothetical protein